jgi:hypothetical protein
VVQDNTKFGYYLSELPKWKDILKKAIKKTGNNYGYQENSTMETNQKSPLCNARELSNIYNKAYYRIQLYINYNFYCYKCHYI